MHKCIHPHVHMPPAEKSRVRVITLTLTLRVDIAVLLFTCCNPALEALHDFLWEKINRIAPHQKHDRKVFEGRAKEHGMPSENFRLALEAALVHHGICDFQEKEGQQTTSGSHVLRSVACKKISDLRHDGKGVVRVPVQRCSARGKNANHVHAHEIEMGRHLDSRCVLSQLHDMVAWSHSR